MSSSECVDQSSSFCSLFSLSFRSLLFLFFFFLLFSSRRLTAVLLAEGQAVLLALVEGLDMGDGEKAADEVADALLAFLSEHGRILPFLRLLIAREVSAMLLFGSFFFFFFFFFFLFSFLFLGGQH